MADPEAALRIANASGFLFQLSVENAVRSAYSDRPLGNPETCSVVAREYPWISPTGTQGYIDLVLSKWNVVLIVECKRTRDGLWVFPIETKSYRSTTDIRALWVLRDVGDKLVSVTDDFIGGPDSLVSQFCAIRGSGEGQTPMLERISATLIQSLEAFAAEAISITQMRDSRRYFFLPVIVTNATLATCVVDPSEIDLNGDTSEANVEETPFIRFHKPLVTELTPGFATGGLGEALSDRERTVFVVNSRHLLDFLRGLRVYE